jgi:hypothetical protein
MTVAVLFANLRKDYAPMSQSVPLRERIAAMKGPWQFLVVFLVTIGGIYAGIFSPTEAASVGAAGVILLGALAPPADARRPHALDREHRGRLRHVVCDRVRRQPVFPFLSCRRSFLFSWRTVRRSSTSPA